MTFHFTITSTRFTYVNDEDPGTNIDTSADNQCLIVAGLDLTQADEWLMLDVMPLDPAEVAEWILDHRPLSGLGDTREATAAIEAAAKLGIDLDIQPASLVGVSQAPRRDYDYLLCDSRRGWTAVKVSRP